MGQIDWGASPQRRKRHGRGHVILVRYADDIVAGFEHKADADADHLADM
jgi:hypothetical protein